VFQAIETKPMESFGDTQRVLGRGNFLQAVANVAGDRSLGNQNVILRHKTNAAFCRRWKIIFPSVNPVSLTGKNDSGFWPLQSS
jgi:hypothetical protein